MGDKHLTVMSRRAELIGASLALALLVASLAGIAELNSALLLFLSLSTVSTAAFVFARTQGMLAPIVFGCLGLAILVSAHVSGLIASAEQAAVLTLGGVAFGVAGAVLVGGQMLRQARKDLEASRAELSNFMDSPHILWRATPDAKVDLYNRRYSELVGRQHADAISAEDWLADFHPADGSVAIAEIRAAMEGTLPFQTKMRLRHADGSYRWMSLTGNPTFDAAGELRAYYGSTVDIHDEVTAREEAQCLREELEKSQAELINFVDSVPQILWRCSIDAKVDFYNKRFTEVLGRDWRKVIERQDWIEDFHPDDRGWYLERVRETFAAGVELKATVRLRQADGSYRWTALIGRPLLDADGKAIRYYGGTTDIHDEVMAREELQATRAALEASRAEVEFFANSVPHILWRANARGEILSFNARVREVTGIDGNCLREGRRYLEIIHPKDRDAFCEAVDVAVTNQTQASVQARVRQHDGSYRWMHFYERPVTSPSGEIQRFGGSVDIHEEVLLREELLRIREELERGRAELENFADSVPHIQWRLNEEDRVDYLNRQYTEFTGHSREDAIANQTWADRYHPDDIAMAWGHFRRAAETGEDRVNFEYRLQHKDGGYRWVRLSGRAIRSPDTGRIVRWYGGTIDAQEEVLAQAQLQELLATLEQRVEERTAELLRSQARYASLFDVSNMTFAEMDFSATQPRLEALKQQAVTDLRAYFGQHPGELKELLSLIRTVRVNEALARLLGYADLAELVSNPPAQNASDGEDVLLRQLEMAFHGEDHIDGRTVLIGKNGLEIPVYFTVNRLPDGIHLSSHLNLTEQERVEGLRRAAQDELARANRAATIGAFSASIAHELNQPISSMVMDTQTGLRWLRREPLQTAPAEKILERLARTAQRVADIVHRTRENIVVGRRVARTLDLARLIRQTRDLLEDDLRRSDITLRVDCPASDLDVRGDPVELQQVLVNLINNAADAMREQAERRIVTVSASRADETVTVTVSDTGPGIAEEHYEKLFQPFFTTKATGIGMGLQICRAAIEAAGGTLVAENGPSGGARFSFTLLRPEPIPCEPTAGAQ